MLNLLRANAQLTQTSTCSGNGRKAHGSLPGVAFGFSSGNEFQDGCLFVVVPTDLVFDWLLHDLLCVRALHSYLLLKSTDSSEISVAEETANVPN